MGLSKLAKALRQRKQDERGAEMIEFAFVVILLITIVYGMVLVGISLAARETINQAVADGARSGIVLPMATAAETTAAETTANTQAVGELGWLGLGDTCGGKILCKTDSSSPSTCPTSYTSGGPNMCVSATTADCPSNTTATCLTVAVNYYDQSAPVVPAAPGLNLITPRDVSSSTTMQVSTPTVS